MPPASRMGEQNRWASAARSRLPSWAPQASACVPKGAACRRTGAIEGNVGREPAPDSPGGMRGPRSRSKIGGRAPRAPERGCPRGHLEPRRACRSARRADALARSKGTSGAHLRLAALAACAGRGRRAKSVGEGRALPNGAALVGNSGLGASIKLGAVPAYDVSRVGQPRCEAGATPDPPPGTPPPPRPPLTPPHPPPPARSTSSSPVDNIWRAAPSSSSASDARLGNSLLCEQMFFRISGTKPQRMCIHPPLEIATLGACRRARRQIGLGSRLKLKV